MVPMTWKVQLIKNNSIIQNNCKTDLGCSQDGSDLGLVSARDCIYSLQYAFNQARRLLCITRMDHGKQTGVSALQAYITK